MRIPRKLKKQLNKEMIIVKLHSPGGFIGENNFMTYKITRERNRKMLHIDLETFSSLPLKRC